MDPVTMVQRSGDTLIVRSVVSGNQLYLDQEADQIDDFDDKIPTSVHNSSLNDSFGEFHTPINHTDPTSDDPAETSGNLPQCKIKRNYSCSSCSYFTQNPRHFLSHLKDVHGEKIIINKCKHCLYASRHYQKLVRHMKMVHGSTDGLEEQALSRKRASQLAREQKKRKNSMEELQQQQMQQQQQIQLQIQRQYQQQMHQNQSLQELDDTHSVESYGSSPEPQEPMVSLVPYSIEGGSSSPDNNKLLKCTVCDYTTYWGVELADHERDAHDKTNFFRCEKCSYVTHIKARFSKHVKYHSMPMIKCVMCDFRTPYKWNLDRHMKNHGGAGMYKCSACNFTADIKQSLTVHEMNHHVPPVGHASGMSMARRKNKVGGTDIIDQFMPMNLADTGHSLFGTDLTIGSLNNNNSGMDSFNEPLLKKIKLETPADLSITKTSEKKPSRPVPNLIPILPLSPPPANAMTTSSAAMNLIMPGRHFMPDRSFKDLASFLIQANNLNDEQSALNAERMLSQLSPGSNASSSTSANRRKVGNFFDKFLKNGRDVSNLVCGCGHTAKCVSERLIHLKQCTYTDHTPVNLSLASNTSSGSTRCQYCRHRCKTSADLYVHLQQCLEARSTSHGESIESSSNYGGSNDKIDLSEDCIDEEIGNEHEDDSETEPHPMENRVFVWNNTPNRNSSGVGDGNGKDDTSSMATHSRKQDNRSEDSEHDEISYYGYETAPGYGEVTKKLKGDEEDNVIASASLKKVFKCPHCSFWASTASRFHVHIVGHLNKKPFECSLCAYRSNWRWDITKHIRLKTIRDPSHKNASVMMNDETGRRNYTKYNKHITLMKVTEEDGDPKLLKSGEMTPSQEATLSFLGQSSSDSHGDSAQRKRSGGGPMSEDGFDSCETPLSLVKQNGHRQNSDESPRHIPGSGSNTPAMPLLSPAGHSTPLAPRGEAQPSAVAAETGKKTSYKCKKCNFRNANRDVVLTHVKGHYHEAGLLLDSKPTNIQPSSNHHPEPPVIPATAHLRLPLALPLSLSNHVSFQLQANHPATMSRPSAMAAGEQSVATDMSMNPATTIVSPTPPTITMKPVSMLMPPSPSAAASLSAVASAMASMAGGGPSSHLVTKQSSAHENGEMDEASSLGSSVTGWRDPSPFRCGHCHQVSNWKHVIQRHCRLKHNRDINIEILQKGSKKGVYIRLHIPGTSCPSTVTAPSDSAAEPGASINNSSSRDESDEANEEHDDEPNAQDDEERLRDIPEVVVQRPNDDQPPPPVYPKPHQLIQLLNQKPKHYDCDLCPYSSPCRSQLEMHQVNQHSNLQHGTHVEPEIIDLDDESNTADHLDLDEAIQSSRVSNPSNVAHDGETHATQSASTTMQQQMEKIREQRRPSFENSLIPVDREHSQSVLEKCPHCPFSTDNPEVLQQHMQYHICVSSIENLVNCDHCDFSVADDRTLREHIRLHFDDSDPNDINDLDDDTLLQPNGARKPVFFTRYDQLRLSSSSPSSTHHNNNNNSMNINLNDERLIFPVNGPVHRKSLDDGGGGRSESTGSDKENKIVVDIRSGDVLASERTRV